MELTFEWDKDRSNQSKHGVSFEEAKTVFGDPRSITIADEKHSVEEDRYIDIGISARGRVVVVRIRNANQTFASLVAEKQRKLNGRAMSKRTKAEASDKMQPESISRTVLGENTLPGTKTATQSKFKRWMERRRFSISSSKKAR